VEAPIDARLVVEAGPGCGKTHVACARVARFLRAGTPPDAILLLSFTRTAVHELRDRIATLAASESSARGVEIRTIDSLAWRIATGVGRPASIASYDDSINVAVEALLYENPELREYLGRFRHVLVDEAQDLVAVRARFILALLTGLPVGTGYTVFVDPAQAIYGWSSEEQDGRRGEQFLDLVPRLTGHQIRTLGTMHRTGDIEIRSLLERLRAIVLDGAGGDRLAAVRKELAANARGSAGWEELGQLLGRTTDAGPRLMLFRRRVEVLRASGYLCGARVQHKLRIGGLPRAGLPWIAVLFNELRTRDMWPKVRHDAAEQAWVEACEGRYVSRGWTFEDAWHLLREIGPERDRVDLRLIVDRLAAGSVPDEALIRDLGPGGPIIGTVHASKGREAGAVVVCMQSGQPDPGTTEQGAEEARVLYVAASRARRELEIRESPSLICGYSAGRAWHSTRGGIQIEIGREGDLDATWPMIMDHGSGAPRLQSILGSFDGIPAKVRVRASRSHGWTRLVELDGKPVVIGTLTLGCTKELKDLAQARVGSWANFIAHLWWIDVVTAAAGPDDERIEDLPLPWRHSRVWLTPIVVGMGFIKKGGADR
jgi:AAA domain/UvrD-like helicase C-terminal domain